MGWRRPRRAKASSVHAPGACAGALGALLAIGDRAALNRVDTKRDTGSAGVGVMTMDAGDGGAIAGAAAVEDIGAAVRAATGVALADGVVDANDDTPATTRRVKSRLLSRAVGSAAAALSTAGFGPVFTGVAPDPGWEVAPPRSRASVLGVSDVARVPARLFEEVEVDGVRAAVVAADPDEPVVVLVCGPPELLTAVSPGGFSGRR